MTVNITTFFVTQRLNMSYHFIASINSAMHCSKEIEE